MLQTIGWKIACMSNDIPVDNKVGGWKLKHKCQKVLDHSLKSESHYNMILDITV